MTMDYNHKHKTCTEFLCFESAGLFRVSSERDQFLCFGQTWLSQPNMAVSAGPWNVLARAVSAGPTYGCFSRQRSSEYKAPVCFESVGLFRVSSERDYLSRFGQTWLAQPNMAVSAGWVVLAMVASAGPTYGCVSRLEWMCTDQRIKHRSVSNPSASSECRASGTTWLSLKCTHTYMHTFRHPTMQ